MNNVQEILNSEASANFVKSAKLLRTFKICYEHGDLDGAAYGIYYACYHAVMAFFVKSGKTDIKTHKGLNIELGKLLRERRLPINHLSTFSKLANLREVASYHTGRDVEQDSLEDLVKPAYALIELMKTLSAD